MLVPAVHRLLPLLLLLRWLLLKQRTNAMVRISSPSCLSHSYIQLLLLLAQLCQRPAQLLEPPHDAG